MDTQTLANVAVVIAGFAAAFSAVFSFLSVRTVRKNQSVEVLNFLVMRDSELRIKLVDGTVKNSTVFMEMLFNHYEYIGFVFAKKKVEKEYLFDLFGPNLERYFGKYYEDICKKRKSSAGNYIYWEQFVEEYKKSGRNRV